MIWFFTPYDNTQRLYLAIDRYFELIDNPDDWVVLMDGDTAFLKPDFGNTIKRYTEKYPDTGMFTCYASRCHYRIQVPAATNMESDSLLYHKTIADQCAEKSRNKIIEINRKIAGHLMVIRKGTWTRIRAEVYDKTINKYILGVDTKISYAILEAGLTIRLMQEMYLLHYCRLAEGFDYHEHIK
jgi:GT2 family glycosyltransferase